MGDATFSRLMAKGKKTQGSPRLRSGGNPGLGMRNAVGIDGCGQKAAAHLRFMIWVVPQKPHRLHCRTALWAWPSGSSAEPDVDCQQRRKRQAQGPMAGAEKCAQLIPAGVVQAV